MSTIEYEIIEKFQSLDKEAQQRVQMKIEAQTLDLEPSRSELSPLEALAELRKMGDYLREKYGNLEPDSVTLLNEAREERLHDLMGSD